MFLIGRIQRSMLFARAFTRPDPNAGRGVEGLERLWVDSPQGRVEAWFLPGEGTSAEEPGPLLVFAHGNAELLMRF